MKKMKLALLAFVGFALSFGATAQPIHDNAVIPLGVTLNSILRLNVVTGGNIEFVFNSISDYESGLSGLPYTTNFEISASQNWDLVLGAEDAALQGEDGSTIDLDNVGLYIETAAGNVHGWATEVSSDYTAVGSAADLPAFSADEEFIASTANGNGGDRTSNSFFIYWRCGTGEGDMNGSSFIDQTVDEGRYSTNVFLQLQIAD